MLKPYHNIEQAIRTLYLKGIEIPASLAFSEIGRALSVITSQFINSEKVNLKLFGYCSTLLRVLPFNQKENTPVADLCERAWTLGDINTISKTIAKLWDVWYRSISDSGISFIKNEIKAQCKFDNWKAKYQKEEFANVLEFCKIIESDFSEYLVDAQIHGSLSDMQMSDYSDLDVLLIVKGEVVTDPAKLLNLREEVLKLLKCIRDFDSLQHHGLFVLTEQEMACYAESRFPLLLMDYATSVMGKPVHIFNTIEDKMQSAASLYNMANRINGINRISPDNYNLKMYSSWIMLLPTMYYQFFNDYVYKAQSFNLVKKEFDEYEWEAVEACTKLRENWNPDEPNNLLLIEIEPEIITKAKKLSESILIKLENTTVNDKLWDVVDVNRISKNYAAEYHPVFYSLEEFSSVEIQWANSLSKIDGVHSVYSIGTNNPTCGISDLDLLVVLEDEFTNDIADKIKALRKSFVTGLSGYIKWHEEIIVEQNDLQVQAKYWEPKPRFLAGEEDLIKNIEIPEDMSDCKKVLLFKEGIFQFFKIMEFFYSPAVPLRLVLLRCNSVKYDIKIAEETQSVTHPMAQQFLEHVESLRNNWFSLVDEARLTYCREIIISSLRILHFILSKAAQEEVGHDELIIFRGEEPELDLGFLKIQFRKVNFKFDDPQNIDIAQKKIVFPIELYPFIELTQQSFQNSSKYNLLDLAKLINPNLREMIMNFQDVWAKGLEAEKLISNS